MGGGGGKEGKREGEGGRGERGRKKGWQGRQHTLHAYGTCKRYAQEDATGRGPRTAGGEYLLTSHTCLHM